MASTSRTSTPGKPTSRRSTGTKLPLGRAFPTTARDRFVRELVLLLKTGHVDIGYFRQKYGSRHPRRVPPSLRQAPGRRLADGRRRGHRHHPRRADADRPPPPSVLRPAIHGGTGESNRPPAPPSFSSRNPLRLSHLWKDDWTYKREGEAPAELHYPHARQEPRPSTGRHRRVKPPSGSPFLLLQESEEAVGSTERRLDIQMGGRGSCRASPSRSAGASPSR
jgi:hypothetical protein